MTGWTTALIALGVLAGGLLAGCSTVPKSFNPGEPIDPKEFSHRAFDELLRANVVDGVVNYPGLLLADARLQTYLWQVDHLDPNKLPTRQDRLAFWINAYNAFAIKGIVDGFSPMSLFGRYRYFIARGYRVGGEVITLYDLERKLLIPDFREPRIHFAIVCASSSCPKLQPWAYSADELDQQLEESAKGFMNDPTRNQFDQQQKIARLSMIFQWFREDFEAQSGTVLNYVKHYVTDSDLAHELDTIPYRVEFMEYDWRLNGPPPRTVPANDRPS